MATRAAIFTLSSIVEMIVMFMLKLLAFVATHTATFLCGNVTQFVSEQRTWALWSRRAAFPVRGNSSRAQINPLTPLPVRHLKVDELRKRYKWETRSGVVCPLLST